MSASLAAATVAATGRGAETLALTLWAEAATRPVRAIEAVACVVVNRARLATTDAAACARFVPGLEKGSIVRPDLWPLLLGRVCRAPFLFACWNPHHPLHAVLYEAPAGDPALAICRRIATRAAAGGLPDVTAGATHCHDAATLPGWAVGRVPTAEIGGLLFYRLAG